MFIKNKRIDTPDEVRSFENGNESRQMLASELTPSKSVHAGMNKEANGRGMLMGGIRLDSVERSRAAIQLPMWLRLHL